MPLGGLGLGLPFAGGASGWIPKELGAGLKLWVRPEELNNPNLLAQTEDFEHATWNTNCTVATGQPDPLGGNTAFKLTAIAPTANFRNTSISYPGSTDVTFSAWVKQGPNHDGSAVMSMKGRQYDGPTNFISPGYYAAPPAEWTRIETTGSTEADSTQVQMWFYPDPAGIDEPNNEILVWHPQMESGIAASPYRANAATISGLIASWPDQSGNGYNAIQATQAKMFLVVANALDGYAAAMSDGVDDYLRVLTGATTVPWTFYFVVRPLAATPSTNRVYYTGTPTNGSYLRWDKVDDKYVAWVPPPTVDSDDASVVGGAWTAFRMKGVADRVKLKDLITGDEHESMGTLVGNPLKNGVYIGSSTGGGSAFFAGMYIEWIVVDEEVSATDDARMMNYLANKYPSLGI